MRKRKKDSRKGDRHKPGYKLQWLLQLKSEVIAAYGGTCACCNEANIYFLTIDHPLGDGAKWRKENGVEAGHETYSWLKRNKYPSGFQVLCWNCNCGRQANGGICPHKL